MQRSLLIGQVGKITGVIWWPILFLVHISQISLLLSHVCCSVYSENHTFYSFTEVKGSPWWWYSTQSNASFFSEQWTFVFTVQPLFLLLKRRAGWGTFQVLWCWKSLRFSNGREVIEWSCTLVISSHSEILISVWDKIKDKGLLYGEAPYAPLMNVPTADLGMRRL